MKNIIAMLDANGGAFPASRLSRYERAIMARKGVQASYYQNRNGVTVVLDMRGI